MGKPKHEPVTFTMYVTNLHKFKTMSFLKFFFTEEVLTLPVAAEPTLGATVHGEFKTRYTT